MKFIDVARLKLKAGNGGNGCISFRREKYVPRGGPNGGNGGNGGNIYFIGDTNKHTLMDFRYKIIYKAEDGENGRGRDQHGKNGENLIIPVPLGTVIKDITTNEVIVDIVKPKDSILIAQGGKGGRGNMCFATAEQRTPRIAEDGNDGEELEIILELKLIADVGVIGLPNAGKSTFISVVSAAKPKIADYPFTTITPNLGVVRNKTEDSFVIADMPGLIENAHQGAGLGQQFLRHIERTKLLLHFVDSSNNDSMIDRYQTIRNELIQYNNNLKNKVEIIVATKIDSAIEDNLKEFREYLLNKGKLLYEISSATHIGIDSLISEVIKKL